MIFEELFHFEGLLGVTEGLGCSALRVQDVEFSTDTSSDGLLEVF